MSLLMFNLAPEQVVLLTDTLSTTPSDAPSLLVSKCVVIPRLEMVVAHTGVALIGQRWAHQLQTGFVARDIDLLDAHVPRFLQEIDARVKTDFGEMSSSSTIYHLGYSQDRECYAGYVYRSSNGYASEPMEPGFRVEPVPFGDFESPGSVEQFVQLGIRLRTEQDARPAQERVYIGGGFVQTVLSDRCTLVAKVFRFDDFEQDLLAMNEALRPLG